MQPGWGAHADFMNGLTAQAFVVVGGPLEGTADTLLIVSADREGEIRQRLAQDPWSVDMLRISRLVPWLLLLGQHRLAAGEGD